MTLEKHKYKAIPVIKAVVVPLLIIAAHAVHGQATTTGAGAYPVKPVRILTGEPGGGNDFSARLIAAGISASLAQQVIVDNRAGVGPEIVAKSSPDGYTLLLYSETLWTRPLMRNMPIDPVRDFSPVSLVADTPHVLVVHPSLPVKTVAQLIALAKLKPGELNYASGSAGSPNHIAGELFKSMAKVNTTRIPYKGTGPAVIDIVSGQVQMLFAPAAALSSHLKSGRLRALAVTGARHSTLLPDLPTVATDLPGYETASIYGVFAPARTPAPVINRLNQEIVKLLNTPEARQRFLNAGLEAEGSTPEQLTATMKTEMARLSKLIKDAGIRED